MTTGTSNKLGQYVSHLVARLAGWQVVTMIALLLVSVLPVLSRAADAEGPTDQPKTEQPTAAATEEATEEAAEPVAQQSTVGGVSDDQLAIAESRVKETEIAYLAAQLQLEQLRTQRRVAELQIKLNAAQTAFTSITSIDPTEGFIKKWLVSGPIQLDPKVSNHDEESNKEYLDREYVPLVASPKEGDKIKIDDTELSWKIAEASDFSIELNKVAEEDGADPEHAAYLGIAYIISDEEIDGVKLAVGSDDDSVWRLNGEEVIRAYGGRGIAKDQNEAEELTLKKGVNILSFTVLNGEGPAAAAARFVDEDGNPIKGLKVSTTPPGQQITATDPAPQASTDPAPAPQASTTEESSK